MALLCLHDAMKAFRHRTFTVLMAAYHLSAACSAPFQLSARPGPYGYCMRKKPCAVSSCTASPCPGSGSSTSASRQPLLACHAADALPRSFCHVVGMISSVGRLWPSRLVGADWADPYPEVTSACSLPYAPSTFQLLICSLRFASMTRQRGMSMHQLASIRHFFLFAVLCSSAFDFLGQFLWKWAMHWVSSSTEQISTTTVAFICLCLS